MKMRQRYAWMRKAPRIPRSSRQQVYEPAQGRGASLMSWTRGARHAGNGLALLLMLWAMVMGSFTPAQAKDARAITREARSTTTLAPFGIIFTIIGSRVRPGVAEPDPPTPPAGTYDYLTPLYDLPTGMTYNSSTGLVEGEVLDSDYAAPSTVVTLTDQGSRAANAAALDAAIATAMASGTGTRLRCSVGVDYGGKYVIPTNASSGWLVIESTAVQAGTFVAEGTTVTAADASLMPNLYATAVAQSVFHLPAGNGKVRFVGLNVALAPSGVTWNADTSATANNELGLITCASSAGVVYAGTTAASYPADIIIDRCIVTGIDGKNLKRGVWMNGARTAVVDSLIDEIRNAPASGANDGQAIYVSSGPGPHKWDHNMIRCGARGEHFMFGGSSNGIIPADIQITRNTIDFPVAWHSALDVKNLGEFKIGTRALVQGNRFQNYKSTGVGSQYYAFVIKSVDQTHGSYPASQASHITVRCNEFKNCSGGVSLHRLPEGYGTATDYIEWTCNRDVVPTSDYTGVPRDWRVQFDDIANMAIRHNSFYATPRNISGDYCWLASGMATGESTGHTFSDNLLALNGTITAANWLGTDNGNGSGATAWTFLKGAGGVMTGNAITRTTTVPSGNTTCASMAAGEVDTSTLALGGTSPLLGTASSGRDPGAVHSVVDTALTGVA